MLRELRDGSYPSCCFPRFPLGEVVGDAGQGSDGSTSSQSPDMEAPDTMLLQMSVRRFYGLAPEPEYGITDFLHPVGKSLE